MLKIKKAPAVEYDCCVLCGVKTEYIKNVPIDQRIDYIEGSGQLCKGCYKDTHPKGKFGHG